MATFKVKFDIITKQYDIEQLEDNEFLDAIGNVNNRNLFVLFGFTKGSQHPVEFNNLKFGYNLRDMDTKTIVAAIAYPLAGMKYMRTDADIIEHTKTNVVAGKNYRLDLWVQENYEETKHNLWFTIPSYSDYELSYSETHPEQSDYATFITNTKNAELDDTLY